MIARQRTTLAERTMAGHDEGNRVGANSSPDSPHRLRIADVIGDIALGDGLAEGDLQQAFPDAHLEVRADQHHPQRLL